MLVRTVNFDGPADCWQFLRGVGGSVQTVPTMLDGTLAIQWIMGQILKSP